MFAFPLRTSARYPGGFDSQKLGTDTRRRQTIGNDFRPTLWMTLGKRWGKRGDELWTIGGGRCGEQVDYGRKRLIS